MSQSTDAILFYGLCFEEEDHQWPWEEDPKKFRLDPEGEELPEGVLLDRWGLDEDLEVGVHCSDGCPMGFVAYKPSTLCANRGYPKRASMDLSKKQLKDAHSALSHFCKKAGYDYDALFKDGRIGWWLCSYAEGL